MQTLRSPLWAVAGPGLALLLGALRWTLQGSGNLYTKPQRRYYVEDPDLGWRVVSDGPVWLGLEVLVLILVLGLAIAGAAWLIRKRERKQERPWLVARRALWLTAALPLVVPLWAFASGLGPTRGVRDTLPVAEQQKAAPTGISGGIAGAAAGLYRAIEHDGSAVTVQVQAGGEAFDTRFVGNLAANLRLDPADLSRPIEAWVRVDAASVDTGITKRSNHAREYLKAGEFPEIRFTMTRLLAAEQGRSASEVAFWARGRIDLMGAGHEVTVTGHVRALDRAAGERLGLRTTVLAVSADFLLDIAQTPLASDAGDFDSKDMPVNVSLLLALHSDGSAGH